MLYMLRNYFFYFLLAICVCFISLNAIDVMASVEFSIGYDDDPGRVVICCSDDTGSIPLNGLTQPIVPYGKEGVSYHPIIYYKIKPGVECFYLTYEWNTVFGCVGEKTYLMARYTAFVEKYSNGLFKMYNIARSKKHGEYYLGLKYDSFRKGVIVLSESGAGPKIITLSNMGNQMEKNAFKLLKRRMSFSDENSGIALEGRKAIHCKIFVSCPFHCRELCKEMKAKESAMRNPALKVNVYGLPEIRKHTECVKGSHSDKKQCYYKNKYFVIYETFSIVNRAAPLQSQHVSGGAFLPAGQMVYPVCHPFFYPLPAFESVIASFGAMSIGTGSGLLYQGSTGQGYLEPNARGTVCQLVPGAGNFGLPVMGPPPGFGQESGLYPPFPEQSREIYQPDFGQESGLYRPFPEQGGEVYQPDFE